MLKSSFFTQNTHTVPSGPVNLTFVDENSTSVLVSWSPPPQFDSIIIQYKVVITQVETGTNRTIRTNNTEVLVTNLIASTEYSVTVFAVSDAGIEVPSQPLAVFTDENYGMFV